MTALMVVDTGEIVEMMSVEEASSITTQISVKLDAIADNYQSVMPLIREAITRQAHVALGYPSAGAYVSDRFGKALSRLGVDTRRQVVKELSEAGLSTRAIAPIVDVSQKTVVTDLQVIPGVSPEPAAVAGATPTPRPAIADAAAPAVPDDHVLTEAECEALDSADQPAPVPVTGLDGKQYSRSAIKPKGRKKPLVDEFRGLVRDLESVSKRAEKLAADDRFNSNAGQISDRYLSDLTRARDALQCVIDQLP